MHFSKAVSISVCFTLKTLLENLIDASTVQDLGIFQKMKRGISPHPLVVTGKNSRGKSKTEGKGDSSISACLTGTRT